MAYDPTNLSTWAQLIDSITRGDRPRESLLRVGPTPDLLQRLGLPAADLAMAAGKIARCRREHPEVSRQLWHRLPLLITRPLAVIPSERRDGSLVVVLVVRDINGNPVLVPMAPGHTANVVLSVYGKDAGIAWVDAQVRRAVNDGAAHYVGRGFAATQPQPGSANAIPSSPGPIPADGTTKPRGELLRLTQKVNVKPPDEA